MAEDSLKYVKEVAIRNYTNVALLLVMVTSVLLALKNPLELILLKLCVVPLFFLSIGGLRSIYREPIVEHKFTVRSIEYTLLQGLVFALFLSVLFWTAGTTLGEFVSFFCLSVVLICACNFSFLALRIKSIRENR